MLKSYMLENCVNLRSGGLALYVCQTNQELMVLLYVRKGDELETVGCVSIQEVRSHQWEVTGTVGAYPGLGAIVYQSALIELHSRSTEATLHSDREYVSSHALSLYHSMQNHPSCEKHPISSCDDAFNSKFGRVLNTRYRLTPSQDMQCLHSELLRAHEAHNLSESQKSLLVEQSSYLGEWVEEHYHELLEERNKHYPTLKQGRAVEFCED
ncbi:hypothetical protein AB6D11_00620 [Vibrio splendidus]